MAYQRGILSDATPVSVGSFASVLTSGSTSTALDTRNYHDVDFIVKITDRQTATLLTITVEFATTNSGTASDWALLSTEEITSGSATQSTYQMVFDLSTLSGAFSLAVSVPVRARYMRIKLVPNATLAATTVNAIRRV